MVIFLYQLLIGLLLSGSIAFLAYLLNLLSLSGMVASILLGSLVIAMGPWYAIILIGLLFGTSAIIQFLKQFFHKNEQSQIIEKGSRRDQQQVLANTLPAFFALLFYAVTKDIIFLIAFVSSLAGATADTWASEVGMLSAKPPRSILTLKPLLKGQSGAISLLGTAASTIGSLIVAASFFLFLSMSHSFQLPPWEFLLIPFLVGISGSIIDSFLGAAIQALYRCVVCGQLTEKEVHHQQATKLIKGYQWANNDMINFLTGLLTVFLSLFLTIL
ncbi:DUF92 domain-containing protein [Enterococcus sp. LJL90]